MYTTAFFMFNINLLLEIKHIYCILLKNMQKIMIKMFVIVFRLFTGMVNFGITYNISGRSQ